MSSMSFWKRLFMGESTEKGNNLTELQNDEITNSFNELQQATSSVIEQALETSNAFKKKLELFERKFEVITDSVDDVIIVKTINKTWVSINKVACQILHLDRDLILGKTNKEVSRLYPKLKPILTKLELAENEAWKEKKTIKFKLTIEENRKTIYLDIIITPVDNGDNNIQELIIVGHNNTKFYNSLKMGTIVNDILGSSSYPVCIIDSYKKINYVNPSFEKFFNTSFDKIINQEFYQILHNSTIEVNSLFEDNVDVPKILKVKRGRIYCIPIINSGIYSPLYYILFFKEEHGKEL